MVNDAVVSIISTDFYGRSKRFKLEDISEETLVQWAVETKQLLLANPELAKTKRIIEDSISPEAKESLWSCSEKLAEVPKEYPAALRTVAERQAFHLEWLDKIVAACAPSSVSLMLHKMREVKWCEHASGDSWRHEGSWKAKDVVAYYAKLKKVENQMGDAAHTVSEKAKLDLVEHKIPSGLKLLAKSTLPRHVGDGPAPQDTWEKALMRIARARAEKARGCPGNGNFDSHQAEEGRAKAVQTFGATAHTTGRQVQEEEEVASGGQRRAQRLW